MKILILGSNTKLFCGWTTMTNGIYEGLKANKVQSYILEGIKRSDKNFYFNNPLKLSFHIRTNKLSLILYSL